MVITPAIPRQYPATFFYLCLMTPIRTLFFFVFFFVLEFSGLLESSSDFESSRGYETCLNDEPYYRSHIDDSFRRSGLASESTIQVQRSRNISSAAAGDFLCVPLTVESLSMLQESHSMAISSTAANNLGSMSPSLNELLHVKRSSSMKSLSAGNSEATTEVWHVSSKRNPNNEKVSLFVPPIPDAPTDSNSTATSSVNSNARIPANFKKVLEVSRFTELLLLEYLEPTDLIKLFVSNSAMSKFLWDHVRTSFNSEFPSLSGISKSAFRLILLKKLLKDPQMKFKDWRQIVHSNSVINLHLFINDRFRTASGSNERFALVDLIEFVRSNDFSRDFENFPRPLNVFFTGEFTSYLEFKTKVKSIVMKAAHYGNIRVLTALYRQIKGSFSKARAGRYILDIFLLGSESRQGVQWTALQHSVHAPNSKVANFLLETLTADEDVLKAHFAHLKADKLECEYPSLLERLIFPLRARKKSKRALQLEMIKACAHVEIRAVHLAIMKAKSANVLSLFLSWEREFLSLSSFDFDFESVKVFWLLAFDSKSLQSLRLVKKFFPANFSPEVAFKSDWIVGFNQFFNDTNEIRTFISRKNNLLHLLAHYGSVNILEYFYNEFMTRIEFLNLSETLDYNDKKPLQIALERGNWEMVKLLIRLGVHHDKRFHAKLLEKNPQLLNDILPDQHDREILAYCFTGTNSHVTLLEWAIISKNQESLKWFLANLPIRLWQRFEQARIPPIHLAVSLGNSEAIKLMLSRFPSLRDLLNYENETPMQVAYRILDRTQSRHGIEVIKEMIETLRI